MKHDYIVSITGALSATFLADFNTVLSSSVYLLTAVYTAYKLHKEIKQKK